MYCILQNERDELLFIIDDTHSREVCEPVFEYCKEAKTACLKKNAGTIIDLEHVNENIEGALLKADKVYLIERSSEDTVCDNYIAAVKVV